MRNTSQKVCTWTSISKIVEDVLGEDVCSRSEREATEDNLAALRGETKIGSPNGQRLLDRAFGAFSGWQ